MYPSSNGFDDKVRRQSNTRLSRTHPPPPRRTTRIRTPFHFFSFLLMLHYFSIRLLPTVICPIGSFPWRLPTCIFAAAGFIARYYNIIIYEPAAARAIRCSSRRRRREIENSTRPSAARPYRLQVPLTHCVRPRRVYGHLHGSGSQTESAP